MKQLICLLALALLLAGCGTSAGELTTETHEGEGMEMGMGAQSGMRERHHAEIPDEYATLDNPVPEDEESLARGAEIYATNCGSCHGDDGMGGGEAGAALDPAPAPVAHTSQMMGDGYLFWRVSEGGAPFDTAMPAWKDALDEAARWDVINYMRTLGASD